MQLHRTQLHAILLTLITALPLQAESIGSWSVNKTDASDPLLFSHAGKTLHMLKNLGPVFATSDGQIGPQDYKTQVTAVEENNGKVILKCRATDDDLTADYTLAFTKLPDGAIELIVDGGKNVSAFQCGTIQGTDAPFKQFYVGQRDMESHLGNDGWPPFIYWPEEKLFFHGQLDLNVSHGGGYDHRMMPKKNFLAKNPPISSDSGYAVLTDKPRPALHERYVFRAAADMWEAYGPVTNKPSEYRQELAEMIFNDIWDIPFTADIGFVEWLKNVTAGRIKFYTVIEQWGWAGFDDSLPDLYRASDHNQPVAHFGTKDELKKLVALGNSMGRTALRTNYMLVQPQASYSVKEGLVKRALNSDGTEKWHSNFSSVIPLIKRQDAEFNKEYGTTACFSDQLSSGGHSGGYVNCDAKEPGAGTISAVRKQLMDMCQIMKDIHKGPLGSESYIADFQFGHLMDTSDYTIFAGDQRHDFTPEEKLRRVHPLTVTHSMGLGYRFFFAPHEKDWMQKGFTLYFTNEEKVDNYRAAEVLYGNGGYLFFYTGMKKAHALTECFTVGVAQRYYALQQLDYVKYGLGGRWKTLDKLITDPKIDSLDKLHAWFKRFHIRYANGCHVYVNRDDTPLSVITFDNRTFKLPTGGWLVYTEDGKLTAYTALVSAPFFPAREERVDFCEDKTRGIRYANPRKIAKFMDVTKPTVWLDGKVHFVLDEPDSTFSLPAKK